MATTHYLHDGLMISRRQKTVDFCLKQLENIEYDGIVVTGVSGILIGSIVSFLTGKNLIVVRKSKDESHSDFDIESSKAKYRKYVILDDQISSGRTIKKIFEKMENSSRFYEAKCVTIMLYASNPDKVQPTTFKDDDDRTIPVIRRTKGTRRGY